jgi:signal transduction histidine kinase/ligand-binding sensor domain-containing protein
VRFRTWNTENGLPQNSVQAIAQTPDGYLWLATRDGLARFDGLKFKIFQKSNTPELPTNRLAWLAADDLGRLWIFPEASPQLVVYEHGSFRVFNRGIDYDFDGVPENWTEGDATVFTENGTDFIYQDGNFTRRSAVVRRREIGVDSAGVIWVDDGTNYYSISSGTVTVHSRDAENPLTQGATSPIYPYRQFGEVGGDGRLAKSGYVREGDAFWFFLDLPKRRALVRFRGGILEASDFTETTTLNMILDRSGLWMGTLDRGIFRIGAGSMDADDLRHLEVDRITTSEGLAGNAVLQLFKDRDGNIWIGGYDGLQLLKDDRTVTVYSNRNGLPANNIYAVAQDRMGAIWFGVWGDPGWIARYADGTLKTYELTLPTAITFDAAGEPIFGANSRLWKISGQVMDEMLIAGFSRSDFNISANGKATLPGTGDIQLYGRPVEEISFLKTDSLGNFWVGGAQGLLRYSDGQARRFTPDDGLPSNSMVAFLETRSGQIWVGTTSGLGRLDSDRFTAFKKAEGLSGEFVRSLYEDSDGVLWIGTYDSGIIRYKEGQFRTIAKKDGLFSDGVFCILEDDDGWFWMNSNQGIHRARKQDLNDLADGRTATITSAGYGVEDGLLNVEGNGGKQPAGLRSTDGRLWFPTAGGLVVIDPKSVNRDEKAPAVLIEDARIDQSDTRLSADGIVLSPDETALEINYTGIKFNNPERLTFRYKVDGLDETWTEAGTRRTAYFSHLPYGEYTFRVTAANRDGVWNENGASVRILIDRPFYRTSWFYGLISLLVIGFVGLVYLGRVKQLKSIADARELYARQLLESQERERSRLAMELHDSLGQNLVIIRNRALLGISRENDSDSMLAQLKEISDASASALQETREIAHTLHPYQIDALGLSTAVRSLIDKFESSSQVVFKAEVDERSSDVSGDVAIAIYRIAQEWLTNVIKHSSATEVSFSLRSDNSTVSLTVIDNGIGFDPQTVKKGLGLRGMEERARMIGARLNISSAAGDGSSLKLTLDTGASDG